MYCSRIRQNSGLIAAMTLRSFRGSPNSGEFGYHRGEFGYWCELNRRGKHGRSSRLERHFQFAKSNFLLGRAGVRKEGRNNAR